MNSQFNSRITTDNCFLYNSNLSSEENYLTHSKTNYKNKFKKKNLYPSTNNSSTIFSYQTQFNTIGNELNCSIDMINKQLSNMLINKKNILSINPKLNHLNNIQNFNFTIEGGNFNMNDLYEENYKLKEENKFLLEKIEEINLSRVDNLSDGPILDDFCNEIGSLKEQISFNENTLASIKSEYQKLLIENDELNKKNIEFNKILEENENLRKTIIELNNKLNETNSLKNDVSKISEKLKNFQEIQSRTINENKEKKRENEQLKKKKNEYNIEKENLLKKISDLKKKNENMNLLIKEEEIIKANFESIQL
jgi:chromosome segregation ATPase